MTSDAARWGPESPTPAQLKEFFDQIEHERITKKSLQEFLRHGAGVTVPADDEWFELEVNDDQDPMEIVSSAGYDPDSWTYLGPKLAGTKVCRAKLVRLGNVRNLAEAREKADKLGYRLLEGQAREFFRAKYFVPDHESLVVFGGSEWRDPDGSERVAHLCEQNDVWHSDFSHSGGEFDDSYRWAVVSK